MRTLLSRSGITCILFAVFFTAACTPGGEPPGQQSAPAVITGLDRVAEYADLFAGKRVGIVTNHTAYNSQSQHIVDAFWSMENVTVTVLFGPEHGIRGQGEAGEKIGSENDPIRQIPIYSLYGKKKKPTPENLAGVDILVFDIQDIGARFYTYIYTMAYAMEAAAENGKPFVVLDRPNPITGSHVEGNILDPAFASFVGLYPIPVKFGMTAGEAAKMFNAEGWLKDGVQAELTVIPLKNWHRDQWYDETGLKFIKPSPNMPSLEVATAYPGTCLLEGTNASEGRGTPTPFLLLGAPWIDGKKLAANLNELNLPGVVFQDTIFTPVSIAGASTNPKHKNHPCGGIYVNVRDRQNYHAYRTGIQIVNSIYQLAPDSLQWRAGHFDRLCGTDRIRKAIINQEDIGALFASWEASQNAFMKMRQKYLLYE